jgi:hypothetical protein
VRSKASSWLNAFLAIEQRRDGIVVISNEIFAAHVQVRLDARVSVNSEKFDHEVLLRSACFDLAQVNRSCNNFNVSEGELALLGYKFAMSKYHRAKGTVQLNGWRHVRFILAAPPLITDSSCITFLESSRLLIGRFFR